MSIDVFAANEQGDHPIDVARWAELSRSVLGARGVKGECEVSLLFVDEEAISALNEQFLGKSGATDVLSFPLSEAGARKLAGELVIGVEVAAEQAKRRGHDVQAELALYVIHGLLHLCGHDDKRPQPAKVMRERERHYLRELGLPDIAEE